MMNDIPKPWYPGHNNPQIRNATQMCMTDVRERITDRNQPELTIGQYNSVYEGVEKTISVLQTEDKYNQLKRVVKLLINMKDIQTNYPIEVSLIDAILRRDEEK